MALQIRHTGQDAGTSMYETEACRAQGAAWKGSGGGDRESKGERRRRAEACWAG